MTDNAVASLAGVVLALLFGYAPGLRPWHENLEPTRKALVEMFLAALVANQAAYLIGVRPARTG